MGSEEDFRVASLAFIKKVGAVRVFDEEKWFSSAYSTLNARFTVKGKGLPKKDKEVLRSILFSSIDALESLSVDDYDAWFFDVAKKNTDSSCLSFGHAQKLINILMKYYFVYFCSDLDSEWKSAYLWLASFFGCLHAPIDRKVLKTLAERYCVDISPEKFSWTKWQWKEKCLYEELQQSIQKLAEQSSVYYGNRLYFEMRELWKADEKLIDKKGDCKSSKILRRTESNNGLFVFLEDVVREINKQGIGCFEVNETYGYFSIQRAGRARYKNVVCFVKNEPVFSISKYANIKRALFDKMPYSKLKLRAVPPLGLQLRKESLSSYPYNLEYDLKADRDIVFELCKKACESFTAK